MNTLTQYQADVESGLLTADAQQLDVIKLLATIEAELLNTPAWKPPPKTFLSRFFPNKVAPVKPVQGLYLWGGVGRGKTHLCDLFFENTPIKEKTRLHFHRFMQRIHDDLKQQGEVENPIPIIAAKWATQSRLLLLDEIHVHDITDAMLLGSLLTELFSRGVTLVTTSNVPPDNLYHDGLQRARFLPAIEEIKNATRVYEMLGETDYRLRLLQTEAIYLVSAFENGAADASTQAQMQAHFDRLKVGQSDDAAHLMVNSRPVSIVARAGDIVWFEFDALCNSARSTSDFIELATEFHTVMLSNVPVLGNNDNDAARRLVNLIDEFYDRNVKLIVSAEAAPNALYNGKRLSFEFERAASRLTEMQTKDYLSAKRSAKRLEK